MAGSDANGNQIDSGPGVVAAKLETDSFALLQCTASPGTLVNLSGRGDKDLATVLEHG